MVKGQMDQHSTNTDLLGARYQSVSTVTIKGVARQECKDKQDRFPGVKNFIALTGHGHNLL